MIQDLKWTWRTLRAHPDFTLIVVLTLALGVGANTAIFSVVHATLLRPLPYNDPERLVRLWSAYPADGSQRGATSPLDLDDWRAASSLFEDMAGYPAVSLGGFVLTGSDRPEEIPTSFVTEGFFETLGVSAIHGRTIERSDHVEGNNAVVVLSHGAWQRRFASSPDIVGRTISLKGEPFTILGVMPASFEYPDATAEIWVPLSLIPETGVPRHRFVRWLNVIARLKPGVSLEQGRAEMRTIAGRLAQQYPDSNERLTAVSLKPLHEEMVGDVRIGMLIVLGAVGFVLLIGCANIANLVLARAEGRSKEIAIRISMGASRSRLVRQLLTESLVLAFLGGLVGLGIALRATDLLVAMAPRDVPRLSAVGFDNGVLLFTGLVSLAAGLLFGLAPALRVAGADLHGFLKEGTRGVDSGSGRRGLRSTLVVAEVALVAVLAVCASLLLRSHQRLLQVDPGLDPKGVLTVGVTAQTYKYPSRPQYIGFFREVLERLSTVPGVESVGMIRPFPLSDDTFNGENVTFTISGQPAPKEGSEPEAAMRFASADYFRTMRIPLLSGRDFNERDDAEHPLVAIVDRTAAETYWPNQDPVGAIIEVGDVPVEVVGVVGAVQQISLASPPTPAMYVHYQQTARVGMTFVLRLTGDPLGTIGAIQDAIWEVDPDQPIKQIATMDQILSESVSQSRFSMTLLSIFAALALTLAGIGIYGVITYVFGQRRHEVGVRMAIGAASADILRLVIRSGMRLAVVGLGIGLAAALAATRLMESLLFQIPSFDLPSFLGASVILLAVCSLAVLVPAVRASRLDPIVCLRHD